jgi:predicted amidohydrolase YtcJ
MKQPEVLKNLMIWNGREDHFQQGSITMYDGFLDTVAVTSDRRATPETKWAVPGFTDSHIHLVNYGLAQSLPILDGLVLEDIQKTLQSHIRTVRQHQWIRGRGWEAACRRQGGFPDRLELDGLGMDNPIALSSKDGHAIWLNSRALHELGMDASIADPAGGRYYRRADGSLTGVAVETAADIVRQKIPAVPESEKRESLRKAVAGLLSRGIVAVHSFEGISELDLLISMSASGELPLKVMTYINLEDFDRILSRGCRTGDQWHGVHMGGLKLYADGTLGSRTAAVNRPYSGEPENTGIDVMDPEQLAEESMRAASHGYPTAIHAIGDRAVSHALQALIAVRKAFPGVKGLRIEHAQLIDREDLEMFSKFDICASVQPCHMISDIDMAERYWSNQTGMFYPYRSLADSGARIVFGSDAPIDDETPLHYLDAAITRRRDRGIWSRRAWHPGECMRAVDALKAVTTVPAALENNGKRRGFLLPGYPADIVVLNRNPFDTSERARDNGIEAVYADGIRLI